MILIVDDDQPRMSSFREMLTLLGKKHVMITRVREVPGYLRDHHAEIEVIVLDILMPDGALMATLENEFDYQVRNRAEETGLILYKYVRSKYPDIPILIHTVVRKPEILRMLKKDGTAYLEKPSWLEDLVEAVEEVSR